LIVEDDQYDPSRTNQAVRKLVEQDGIFALVSGLGTAQHSAVFEYLKESQVPDLFTATGATLFTDPITRTAFGYNPNYVQEGTEIGKYIAENMPDAKIGFILQNDDFGTDGQAGVEAGIEGSNVEVVSTQTYEAVNTDLTQQVQAVINAGADTIVSYSLPLQAGSIMKVARSQLGFDGEIIFSGVIADPSTIAIAEPANAAGAITTAYLKPLIYADDAGVQGHIAIMSEYGPSDVAPTNLSLYGQSVAELAVQVFASAGENLNRRAVVAAAESIRDFTCSVCLTPINTSETDHRPIEGLQFARAEGDDWVPFGDIISFESTQ
jgi:ABC-type branched-subunit amino acid transport system substrate-binding protein